MPTVRDIVSRVRSTHRLLSGDNQINDRTIAAEARSKSILLIKRETDRRKLWNTTSLFTVLNCIKMEPVSLADCCDFVSDVKVSRSVKQIPKLSEGNYQYLIKGVFNVEGNQKLNIVSPERYFNILKLTPRLSRNYAWISEDRYLFCSNQEVTKLKMIAFLEGDADPEMISASCECNPSTQSDLACINPLDLDFKCPGYLEDSVVALTSKTLLESYFRLAQDSSSDAKDGQTR